MPTSAGNAPPWRWSFSPVQATPDRGKPASTNAGSESRGHTEELAGQHDRMDDQKSFPEPHWKRFAVVMLVACATVVAVVVMTFVWLSALQTPDREDKGSAPLPVGGLL